MFIVFGGAAGVAPLVYAATAKQESQELNPMVGSVWGFLLAGAVSLLAVMGELATVGLLVWRVGNSSTVRVTIVGFVAVAAIIVAVYSIRALNLFAAPKGASARRSFLGAANNSATL